MMDIKQKNAGLYGNLEQQVIKLLKVDSLQDGL